MQSWEAHRKEYEARNSGFNFDKFKLGFKKCENKSVVHWNHEKLIEKDLKQETQFSNVTFVTIEE